jgi:isopenicillin-N N-acyltransferase-like protein
VSGPPEERGWQYGRQAASRIEVSIDAYREIFAHYTGWDWQAVQSHARQYAPLIRSYRPHHIDEMRGIAMGAGVKPADILALNVRTEIINTGFARSAMECTAFVSRTADTKATRILIGQNWDWKPAVRDSLVVLEVEPDSGPRFVTVVEAGLLAKTGMNADGIGLVTNALVTDLDVSEGHVPYHTMLRAILESSTFTDAVQAVTGHPAASAGNYLIAHRDGRSVNLEALPWTQAQFFKNAITSRSYVHTNHFLSTSHGFTDIGLEKSPDSPIRLGRMQGHLETSPSPPTLEEMKTALSDHYNYPYSVCCHADPSRPAAEQYATLASVIMDLSTATLWLANGNPCQADYTPHDYSDWLGGVTHYS